MLSRALSEVLLLQAEAATRQEQRRGAGNGAGGGAGAGAAAQGGAAWEVLQTPGSDEAATPPLAGRGAGAGAGAGLGRRSSVGASSIEGSSTLYEPMAMADDSYDLDDEEEEEEEDMAS